MAINIIMSRGVCRIIWLSPWPSYEADLAHISTASNCNILDLM
jgi:hypothetical protein